MFRKMIVAVLGLMMAIGLMGFGAAQAVAAPQGDPDWGQGGGNGGTGNSWTTTNRLDITVVTRDGYGWYGPRVTITTRWGRYVATAEQVGRNKYGYRTEYRYVARDLPWNTPLKVRVSGGNFYGQDSVYFERSRWQKKVVKSVYLQQSSWGGNRY